MSEPIQYADHPKATDGEPCIICQDDSRRNVIDHCHAHGWVRGVLCFSCNSKMGLVDLMITPRGSNELVADLANHVSRCHECDSVSPAQLGPTRSLRSLNTPPNGPVHRFSLYLSDDLYAQVVEAAQADQRSVNSWIVYVLRSHLNSRAARHI